MVVVKRTSSGFLSESLANHRPKQFPIGQSLDAQDHWCRITAFFEERFRGRVQQITDHPCFVLSLKSLVNVFLWELLCLSFPTLQHSESAQRATWTSTKEDLIDLDWGSSKLARSSLVNHLISQWISWNLLNSEFCFMFVGANSWWPWSWWSKAQRKARFLRLCYQELIAMQYHENSSEHLFDCWNIANVCQCAYMVYL